MTTYNYKTSIKRWSGEMGLNWIGFPDGVNWTRNLLNVGTIKNFSIRMIDSMGLHFYLRLNYLEEIVVPVLQPPPLSSVTYKPVL